MKNRVITNSIRSIKKSFSRFLPLFVMSFLGVFVFAGLQSTKPDMLTTLDNFLDKHNVYDIEVISTGGLIESDIEALKKIDGVKNVEKRLSTDSVIEDKEKEKDYVINISNLPKDINTLKVLEGHLPKEKNEIVVEKNFLEKTSYKLGDTIKINNDNLTLNEYKIVGTVESGLYFNNDKTKQDRGTTTIGTGTINYYSYILPDTFDMSYYTSIYITVDDLLEKETSSSIYVKEVDRIKKEIEHIKSSREEARYNDIIETANNEIKEQEDKINNELNDAKSKLDNAKRELDNAKYELDRNYNNLMYFKSELNKARTNLDNAKVKYNEALSANNIKESEIDNLINELNQGIKTATETLSKIPENLPAHQELEKKIQELTIKRDSLQGLKNAKASIVNGENEYNKNLNNYNYSWTLYNNGKRDYNNGLEEYNKGYKEYSENKNKAENKISDARKELEKIEKPSWMINDRTDNGTYQEYINDITSIQNLSKIFPIVFFAVAILVSLISMSRMVEEERVEIGTLKSLGFTNNEIMIKYLLFSGIATTLGGILGGIIGVMFIPTLIFNIYGLLFNIPNFHMGLNLEIIILSVLVSIICICGTTIFTIIKVLKEKPSELMRPKAPKKGKRILLERWKFFWNKISFSNKVTLRNLFRYKKRAMVTIVGIAGCAALMLCGFGIRDAIVDIANMQYKETFIYDAMVLGNDIEKEEVFNNKLIKDKTPSESINVRKGKVKATLNIIDKDKIDNVVNLVDKDNKKIELTKGKVVITDKFSDLTNTKIGDTLEVYDDNNKKYTLEVSGITKNYLMHFIYMDKETYEEMNTFKPNVMYLNLDKLSKEEETILTSTLMEPDDIYNVMYIDTLLEQADNMLLSLNKVVLIIIILSASLSFVVLYNLSNININERKREISTLKVLGFYDKEVDNYITKENLIFTFIGILIGLFGGYFLTRIVISTVEIDIARFIHNISFNSYLYTSIITIIFTLIVNLVTHFNLKKIDMIASLKSVD